MGIPFKFRTTARVCVVTMVLGVGVLFSNLSMAREWGVVGQTYPILEDDLLQFIQQRIYTMQQNGEWSKIQNDFRARVEKKIDRPTPVKSVMKPIEARSWMFDPSITVPYDLKDHNGIVFAKAGTKVNPLSIVSFKSTLLFYDGDDKAQVKWAKELDAQLNRSKRQTKLILVKGSVVEQATLFAKPIYFDQEGKLVGKFGIQHVPAVVSQSGLFLQIAEVRP